MRIRRLQIVPLTTALALLSPTAAAAGQVKHILVVDGGKKLAYKRYFHGTVGAFLRENHIRVRSEDRVLPHPTASVHDGMSIVIEHPKHVRVIDGGRPAEVRTFARTVGDLFRQLHLRLHPLDQVNTSPAARVTDGMTIQIHRIQRTEYRRTEAVPYRVRERPTDQLYVGERAVVQAGQAGEMSIRVITVTRDGTVIGRTVIRRVVRQPVDEIVAVGTRQRPAPKPWHAPPALHLTARQGGSAPTLRAFTAVVTAYVAGGRTSTGVVAQPGVVAVDPSVIPYGTKLYVPGYGLAVAADTGGSIVGNRLDVCMPSTSDALAWGVRTLTVYIVGAASA
ncbi:hypothetical protein GCM10010885_18980 [Alicyclobacillus cellulosilyticus]|uniref:G5 domain-containing protein n=1 Tax=Alicyclobacillus cellulosilyticus TaxID=1003997 RepID=A0A917NLM7_9BACL|nr:3D domain-containing protein [Alicyclobacillus cellulosilyticus]GGJ10019.1 hypothetical protein GCM10010885_18980 [Alicyclobacillus cellulosilyticus]